ncbi:MAG: hypothetical protein CL465_04385 [Acidimicrobiaceae bacterium]|nr:hypothetical protein [Acidimicrobiaceae bacterium]|tara:strand:- start:5387 stop:5875 length:489 start_codon:yes stop_codon:yes gene_type:complete
MYRQNSLDDEKNKIAFIFAGVSASSNTVAKSAAEDFKNNGIRAIMFTINPDLRTIGFQGTAVKASVVRSEDFYNYDLIDCSEIGISQRNQKPLRTLVAKIELATMGRRYWKLIKGLVNALPSNFEPSLILYSDHDSLTPVWHLAKVWGQAKVGKVGSVTYEN